MSSWMTLLQPGARVTVYVGGVRHEGIVSDAFSLGEPYVISNSRRTGLVAEEPLSAFSQGRDLQVLEPLADVPVWWLLLRARSRVGEPWRLLTWNCEHFVRWCYGVRVESPQLQLAGALLLVGAVAAKAVAKRG